MSTGASSKTTLSTLPVELLLVITEDLDWADNAALRYTCRTFYGNLPVKKPETEEYTGVKGCTQSYSQHDIGELLLISHWQIYRPEEQRTPGIPAKYQSGVPATKHAPCFDCFRILPCKAFQEDQDRGKLTYDTIISIMDPQAGFPRCKECFRAEVVRWRQKIKPFSFWGGLRR